MALRNMALALRPPFLPITDVYSYEAVKELNLKAGSLVDLIDNSPFQRSDIITIQDPTDGSTRELTSFSHVKNNMSAKVEKDTGGVRHTDATSRVMAQLAKSSAAPASATKPADSATANFREPEKPAAGGGAAGKAGKAAVGSGGVTKPRWCASWSRTEAPRQLGSNRRLVNTVWPCAAPCSATRRAPHPPIPTYGSSLGILPWQAADNRPSVCVVHFVTAARLEPPHS